MNNGEIMKTDTSSLKISKRCPVCDWRIFDKVTPASGIIEIKCPKCGKVVTVNLSCRCAIQFRFA